jgi:hypothetical protein
MLLEALAIDFGRSRQNRKQQSVLLGPSKTENQNTVLYVHALSSIRRSQAGRNPRRAVTGVVTFCSERAKKPRKLVTVKIPVTRERKFSRISWCRTDSRFWSVQAKYTTLRFAWAKQNPNTSQRMQSILSTSFTDITIIAYWNRYEKSDISETSKNIRVKKQRSRTKKNRT